MQTASGVGPKLAQAMLAVLAPDDAAPGGRRRRRQDAHRGARASARRAPSGSSSSSRTGSARPVGAAARGRGRGAAPDAWRGQVHAGPGRARLVGQGGRPGGRRGRARGRRRRPTPDVAAPAARRPAHAEQGVSRRCTSDRARRPPSWPTSSSRRSLTAAEAEGDERAVEAALRPRTLDEVVGQERVREQLVAGARGRPAPRAGARPRAALRAARARQDHAGDDHRRRDERAAAADQRARRSPTPATSRRSCPASTRATCSSSTRSTGCRGRPRRCSTWRWRTSGSTSSSARAPAPPRSRWRSRRSRWSAPPPGPGCCPARCATGSASPRHLEFYEPDELDRIVRRSAGLLGVELDRRGRRRDRLAVARARPGSPTGCCAGSATSPRSAPTAWSPATSPARALDLYEVDESGLDRLDRAVLDVAVPPLRRRPGRRLARSRSPSARSARPSRRSPSRSWSATASWPARRAGGWRPRPPGSTSGSRRRRAPVGARSAAEPRRAGCSTPTSDPTVTRRVTLRSVARCDAGYTRSSVETLGPSSCPHPRTEVLSP